MNASLLARGPAAVFALLLLATLTLGATRLRAVGYAVDREDDPGAPAGVGSGNAGSLRYCINQANANPGSTINFQPQVVNLTLTSSLPAILVPMEILSLGQRLTINANNTGRIFFIDAGAGGVVLIKNVNLQNGRAKGGDGGGGGGGGGLGAGGAIFVNTGAVRFEDSVVTGCSAVGGNGGPGHAAAGGGGGGLGGNGGAGGATSEGGGGGGGGFFGDGGWWTGGGGGYRGRGGDGTTGNGGGGGGNPNNGSNAGAGGAGGASGGGAGVGSGTGGAGGLYGGGGGGNTGGTGGRFGGGGGARPAGGTGGGSAGAGGDFGGGGGAASTTQDVRGGAGGFGGGGGGSDRSSGLSNTYAGNGGFGGGSGGYPGGSFGGAAGGTPGAFGGSGGRGPSGSQGGGGGGGALGGAIFVRQSSGTYLEIVNVQLGAGTVQAGSGGTALAGGNPGTSGSQRGSTVLLPPGDTYFNSTGSMTVSGEIADLGAGATAGVLAKIGSGQLTLDGASTYQGGTRIEAGELRLIPGTLLGPANAPMNVLADARLLLDGTSFTVGTLQGLGTVENPNAGLVTLTAGAGSTGGQWDGELRGNVQLIKTGSGAFTLGGANRHTGGTDIQGGLVQAYFNNNSKGALPGSGRIAIPDRNVAPALPASATRIRGGTQLQAFDGDSFGYFDDNAALYVDGGSVITRYFNRAPGQGVWTTLQCVVLNAGSLGADPNSTDGTWYLNGPIFSQASAGSSVITTPFLILKPGYYGTSNFPAGAPSFNDTYLGVEQGAAAIDLDISSVFYTQPGDVVPLLKYGAGTLRLTGRSVHLGATRVVNGVLIAAATGQANGTLPGTGRVAVADPNVLPNLPIQEVIVAPGALLNCAGNEPLGFGDGNPLVYAEGGIVFASGSSSDRTTLQFTLLRLGGMLSGATNQSYWRLAGPVYSLASSATNVIANARVRLESGTYGIGNFGGATPSYNNTFFSVAAGTVPGGVDLRIDSYLTGPGAFEKYGDGTVRVTSNLNDYQGGTFLYRGVLEITDIGVLSAVGLIGFRGGTLRYVGVAPDLSARFEPVAAGQAIRLDTNGQNATYAAAMSGAGGFQKLGAGTLTLGGANTFSGTVTLTAGGLTLTGNNTWSGGAVVALGTTLQVGAGATVGALTGNVQNNGQLSFRRSDPLDYTGVISGPGGVDHDGGNLFLRGASTGTGTLTIRRGSVILPAGGAYVGGFTVWNQGRVAMNLGSLGSNAVSSEIQAGGQLDGRGTVRGQITNAGTISTTQNLALAGSLTVAPGGVLRAAQGGVLDLSGLTTLVNNGVIDVITGSVTGISLYPPSPNFVNNGVVLDYRVVKVKTLARAGNAVTLTIDSYDNHTYTLQKSTSLSAAAFADVAGSAQAGLTGTTLTFQDTDTSAEVFYRVKVE